MITINDDSPETLTNPIDDNQNFVYMQYHDFLNREPDAAGLAFWTSDLAACGNDQSCLSARRSDVSAAFFLSIEFQETGYLVYRIYKASYGNLPGMPVPVRFAEFTPDREEISRGVVVNQAGWEQLLENNKQAFAAEFVQRNVSKPVVGFIAGQTAPPGRRMGHAGAIISGSSGTAAEKMMAFEKAGIAVMKRPADVVGLLRERGMKGC